MQSELYYFSVDKVELVEYLTRQTETLHNYVSNLDSVLEALDVHKNSLAVLTVLGVKTSAQQPSDISGVQYHTATATQINDFVNSVNEQQLRDLNEIREFFYFPRQHRLYP